jgi:hypothetical protein
MDGEEEQGKSARCPVGYFAGAQRVVPTRLFAVNTAKKF